MQCLGGFKKNAVQAGRTIDAVSALKFLHDYLGWTGSARPVALGIFGILTGMAPSVMREANRLCKQFDERFPSARL
ncbi:MAG TPA: hypothetical protein VF614_02385 [Chthoniobacteraceae bacterium]